jgi:hypothetical protein
MQDLTMSPRLLSNFFPWLLGLCSTAHMKELQLSSGLKSPTMMMPHGQI